ncbi:MAG: radical SAM protein [Lachnospiraceae bacterium]|nr:radical SAM protein [Lachnospiraceae bacterium]
MRISEKECKSIMVKSKLPDADYVINPYVGCCHQCIYCYAQFMSRFTGHAGEQWGSYMDIKRGGELIKKDLSGKTVLLGSVTDPYNPLEKKYGATRQILQKLLRENTNANIEILTKSPLVVRDIDLLRQFDNIRIGISLSTMDAVFAKRIEKNVVSPQERVDAMKELHRNGIRVYAFVSPIFPLTDGWKQVVDQVREYADLICFENLNLRANYKYEVLEMIREFYPDKYDAYVSLYSNPGTLRAYWESLATEIGNYLGETAHKLYFFHDEIKKK